MRNMINIIIQKQLSILNQFFIPNFSLNCSCSFLIPTPTQTDSQIDTKKNKSWNMITANYRRILVCPTFVSCSNDKYMPYVELTNFIFTEN